MTVQDLINLLQQVPAPTNTNVQVESLAGIAGATPTDATAVDDSGVLTITPTGIDALSEDGGDFIIQCA